MVQLANAGFELDWSVESKHSVYVYTPDGQVVIREIGNAFVPPHWNFGFYHDPGRWDQPECRDAHKTNDPDRVKSGDKAFMWFTTERNHDVVIFQQVDVKPGQTIRFSGWMHAWSNHKDDKKPDAFPHPNDGNWSEGSGYEKVAWEEGTQPEDGTAQQDAKSNFTFMLGIDPYGGNNPFSPTVVWGDAYHIYNGYVKELSVEAQAESDEITVFARSRTKWAFKHNDSYIDDLKVEVIDTPIPPPPEECRGTPREQYERTYVLLPKDSEAEFNLKVLDMISAIGERWTLGGSADDAGIGDLDVRRVIIIDPSSWANPDWPTGLVEQWYERYYPGVTYYQVNAENDVQLEGQLLAYSLKEVGIELFYPVDYYPPTITDKFGVQRASGYHRGLDLRASYQYYNTFVYAAYGGTVTEVTTNSSLGQYVRTTTRLSDGRDMVLCYAHLVPNSCEVAVGQNIDMRTRIGKAGHSGTSADHLHFSVRVGNIYADPELLIDFPVDDPKVTPPAKDLGTKLGVHVLRSAGGLGEYLDAGARVALAVGDFGAIYPPRQSLLSLGAHPGIGYDAQSQYHAGESPYNAALKFMNDTISMIRANDFIEYWCGHNEPVWNTQQEMAWYAQFEIERMKMMHAIGKKCVIGNFATGTPPLDLWESFVGACQVGIDYKAILGLHEYSCPYMWWMTGDHQIDPNDDQGDEGWTTLRYRKVYRQYLIPGDAVIPLVVTESGIDPLVNPKPPGSPNGAWSQLGDYWCNQDEECDKEDFYYRQLLWYENELRKDFYAIGACIFTVGSWGGWGEFDIGGTGVIEKLTSHAVEDPAHSFDWSYYVCDQVTPPTPPPPPPHNDIVLVGINAPDAQDEAGAWLASTGNPGILYVPVFMGTDNTPMDFSNLESAGIDVFVNLRYSWSTDLGGAGTLPPYAESQAFIDAAISKIKQSKGITGVTIGNEVNNPREYPKNNPLTPTYVATIYNDIRSGLPASIQLSPSPIDPFFGPNSDCGFWFRKIWELISDAEFIDLHGYIRGPNPDLCWSELRFADDPLRWQGQNYFECCRTFLQEKLPEKYRGLPMIISEFNHLWKGTGDFGWVDDDRAGEVIKSAVKRAEEWDAKNVIGICVYRWKGDEWDISGNQHILDAIQEINST